MPKPKQKYDVLGYKMGCRWFHPCPLCLGCRAYDGSMKRCEKCARDAKFNICNRYKHRDDLLAKMIKRERIELEGDIKFV